MLLRDYIINRFTDHDLKHNFAVLNLVILIFYLFAL